ncbi:MAG: hypothetical protein IJU41_04395 [Clostridia bacterium]|nr:hypothetical protein [Clostridia bacterium]
MKHLLRIVCFILFAVCLCAAALADEAVVYLDGTGSTEGAYTTLQAAASALPDAGGHIIVCGDTATPNSAITLAGKSGKVRVTGQNGAKLTMTRTLKFASEYEFDDIELVSSSSTYGFIYAQGNKLTFGENVVTSKTSGAKWFSVFGGVSSGTVDFDSHLVLRAGTYQFVYGGNYQGSFSGASTVEASNITVTGTLSAENYTGTYSGTPTLIFDLRGGKTVGAGSFVGTPTLLTDDGYEAVLEDGVYVQRKAAVVGANRIYVADGGTGDGLTALAPAGSLTDACATLDVLGGEIILVGDTTVSGAVTLAEKSGAVTLTSVNGAKLLLSGSLALTQNTNGAPVTFDLPITASGGVIYGGFRNVTFTENCSVTGTLDFYGGTLSDDSGGEDNRKVITELPYTVTINGGTFRKFSGGVCRTVNTDMLGAIAAPLTVNITGGSFTGSFDLSGGAFLADDVTLTISGGSFACPIYVRAADVSTQSKATRLSPVVTSSRRYYAMDGDVAIRISGGDFTGGRISAYLTNVAYTQLLRGNFTVDITGGSFAAGTVIDATQVKPYAGGDEIASLNYTSGYTFDALRFDEINGVAQTYDEPLRIAFVGDSITEGVGSSDSLTMSFPADFAALCAADHRDTVLANYGVSAAGVLESTSVYYFERIAYRLLMEETDADYIVVGLGTNDHLAAIYGGLRAKLIENYTNFIEQLAALPTTDKILMTSAIISGTKATPAASQLRIRSVIAPLQRQMATAFAARDPEKFVFVDLFGLTLPAAAAGNLLSGDRLHPKNAGYVVMANMIYNAIFDGVTQPSPDDHRTDIWLSAAGADFGSGSQADPTSRLDIAFAAATPGQDVTLHVVGTVSYQEDIITPLGIGQLTVVGEGEGACLDMIEDGATIWANGDLAFDNITVRSAAANARLIGNYHNIELTETTALDGNWSFYAGACAYNAASAEIPYDTAATVSFASDCTVRLSGVGAFVNFTLGNCRDAALAPVGTYSGDLTAFVGDGYSASGTVVGAAGQNYLSGSITASLPHGFVCADYAPVGDTASPVVYDSSLNTGSVTLTRRDAPESLNVVYVSGSGTGDGKSAASPTADIAAAYALLGEDGGTVVFVGEYTTSATVNFPAHTAKVTLTSVYGTDYRTAADASIRYLGTGFIKFGGPTEIDGLTVKLDKSSGGFCANNHPLTVGSDFAVVNTDGTTTYRMYLVGGQNAETVGGALGSGQTNTIEIYSGKFNVVSGFSRNAALDNTGTVTIRVGGTADIKSLYFGAVGSGAKGGTAIVYMEDNAKVTTAYLSGNTVGMNGSVTLTMEDSAAVGGFANSAASYFPSGTRTLYYTSTVALPGDFASHFDSVTQTDYVAEAPRSVLVDGTGLTEGAYATLEAAFEALNAEGGSVVVCGDTTVSGVVELARKSGKVTVSALGGAKLTIARTLKLTSEVEFDNIELVSSSSGYGFVYAQGSALTIGRHVTTSRTEGAKWLTLIGGASSGTVAYNTHLTVKAGTYAVIYGGNNTGSFSGTSTVEVSDITVTGTLSAESYSGTYSGTPLLILDLRGGKTVTAGTFKGTPTFLTDDGYEAALTGGTYAQRKIEEGPAAEPRTVYVDGTGKTPGAYASLAAALAEMPGGGRIILSGDTEITSPVTFAKTAAVTITSVDEENDYTGTAALKISADVTLGGDTTFENIVIERTKLASGQLYIIAAGHALTFESGVICLNYTGVQWISLVGGNYDSAFAGDTHITVKSGHFRNLFAGNYTGAFTGNTYLNITGGVFDNAVCGGSYNGNFTGDTHITFGGEAVLLYGTAAPQGIIGGNLGGGSTAYTFTGDTHLLICGNAGINGNVIGASRASNITHKGDVFLEFADNAFIYYSSYAGGYAANLTGNTRTVFNGGDMQGDMFGGGNSGSVSGNTEIIVNSGKVCYYKTNLESGWSEPAGEKNLYGGGATGTVGGSSYVEVNGGRIFGDVYGGGQDAAATVGGIKTVKATGGMIFGKIANADSGIIDLSAGGSLSVGVSSTVSRLVGGGTLTLAAGASLNVGTAEGVTGFTINGLPLPKTYLTVREKAAGAAIGYTAQESEVLTESEGVYAIDFDGAQTTVRLTVNYAEGCVCRLRPGKVSSGDYLTPVTNTSTASVYMLTPGLYTAKVSYNGAHYYLRYIYIYGRSGEQTVDCIFPDDSGVGYEGLIAGRHIDEINEVYYNDNDITGFYIPNSPYFNNRPGSTIFTTNEEVKAFIDAKAASCGYMYAFYPAKTRTNNFDLPLVVFTKDEIPAGASLAEIAEIVQSTAGRDIFLITCGVHGNEASASEGGLALISELCGAYGERVFDGTNVGAVVIFPRVNPEGAYSYIRATNDDVVNKNLNRDYMTVSDVATATYSYVYDLFMPTMTVDTHESHIQPVFSEGEIMTDNYDVGLAYFTSASSIHGDAWGVLSGDLDVTNDYTGQKLCDTVIAKLRADYGLRSYYFHQGASPGIGRNYANHLGSIGFTLEIPGIWGAEEHYARRVFTQMTALKVCIGLAIESDGALAAEVAAKRAEAARAAQIYDARRPIVLKNVDSSIPTYGFAMNNPIVAADGTVRVPDHRVWQNPANIAAKYRTMPTAYVIPANVSGIGQVLARLDTQLIAYKFLEPGTVMTLQQYGGTTSSATLSAAKEVTFASGAYLIPVDGYRAYITAYLFEPDNNDVTEGVSTFAQVGDLAVSEIYRSTESFIAAKHGMDGSYIELSTGGKSVESASADGEILSEVYTEGDFAYLPRAERSITLRFTDGTSETYRYTQVPGDADGDGEVTLYDAVLALRAMLDGSAAANADLNGDGKIGISDIIRILKLLAA